LIFTSRINTKLTPCYNRSVTQNDNLKAYLARWAEIDLVIREEQSAAPLELRWQQLNAAYAMALGLGLLQEDPSEVGVYGRWAKLKEKAASQPKRA
jgi:hypothetical protein